jgi:hypothetical protein
MCGRKQAESIEGPRIQLVDGSKDSHRLEDARQLDEGSPTFFAGRGATAQ